MAHKVEEGVTEGLYPRRIQVTENDNIIILMLRKEAVKVVRGEDRQDCSL